MKKFMISYYSITPFNGKHEISIYKNLYGGDYYIYFDGDFWTSINSLYEFENELNYIENSFNITFAFYGF